MVMGEIPGNYCRPAKELVWSSAKTGKQKQSNSTPTYIYSKEIRVYVH